MIELVSAAIRKVCGWFRHPLRRRFDGDDVVWTCARCSTRHRVIGGRRAALDYHGALPDVPPKND